MFYKRAEISHVNDENEVLPCEQGVHGVIHP